MSNYPSPKRKWACSYPVVPVEAQTLDTIIFAEDIKIIIDDKGTAADYKPNKAKVGDTVLDLASERSIDVPAGKYTVDVWYEEVELVRTEAAAIEVVVENGKTVTISGDIKITDVYRVKTAEAIEEALKAKAKKIILEADIEIKKCLVVDSEVTIDLNGYRLNNKEAVTNAVYSQYVDCYNHGN